MIKSRYHHRPQTFVASEKRTQTSPKETDSSSNVPQQYNQNATLSQHVGYLNVDWELSAAKFIRQLKKNREFGESIRDYCEDNFFVMYWLEEQIQLFNENPTCSVSVLATSSDIEQCTPRVPYLYQAVMKSGNMILPFSKQFLHDMTHAGYHIGWGNFYKPGVSDQQRL